jgi:hypothetical protein
MERLEMRLRFARTRIGFRIRARLTLMLDGLAGRCDPLSPVAFMLDEDAFSWEDDDWDVPGNPDYGFPREEGDYRWYLGDN